MSSPLAQAKLGAESTKAHADKECATKKERADDKLIKDRLKADAV